MKHETLSLDQIKDVLVTMETAELIEVNNIFCDLMHYHDDVIYNHDEDFYSMFFGGNPMESARAAYYGEYNYHHEYVRFNGYGNLETFDYMTVNNLPDILDNICECINDNFDQFEHLFN